MISAYALLVLQDGTSFYGHSIGAEGKTVGETIFNTTMTGYQEILTDPSYSKQIVTLTYPHIGNVGTNPEDQESEKIHAQGLIVRHSSIIASNYRQTESLPSYLKRHNIVAIADIDTRKLTHILREKGAQTGCIITVKDKNELPKKYNEALDTANQFPGLKNLDLAKEVSCKNPYRWQPITSVYNGKPLTQIKSPLHIVAYDFGIKRAILTMLAQQNCKITVVPATTSAKEAFDLNPDGIFLSNGPGDPAACHYAIKTIGTFLEKEIPLFGICLGHQLLALTLGAKTIKMKFGHHGGNHPVKDIIHNNVMITSQNHGFTVDESTLPSQVIVTHRSLFDGSLQGISHSQKPAFGFQGHPEASPGPHDVTSLFKQFTQLINKKNILNSRS